MESERTQLRVYLDFNFWKKFTSEIPTEDIFSPVHTEYGTFRNLFVLISNADIRSLKNGKQYPINEYQKALAKIAEGSIMPPPESAENLFGILNNLSTLDFPHSIFLVELNDTANDRLMNESGYAFANSKQSYVLFDKLSFSNKMHTMINVVPGDDGPSVFDHSQLRSYQFPTNFLYYIDVYLTTWSKKKVIENLVPELESLFIDDSQASKRVTLISVYNELYLERNKGKKSLSEFVADAKWLYGHLNIYFRKHNIKLSIIYFKKKDLHIEQLKDVKNPIKIYKDFYNMINNTFHDRETYSNYLYTLSGRSRDFNMKYIPLSDTHVIQKRTKLSLNSIVNKVVLDACIEDVNNINQIIEFSKKEELKDYTIQFGL